MDRTSNGHSHLLTSFIRRAKTRRASHSCSPAVCRSEGGAVGKDVCGCGGGSARGGRRSFRTAAHSEPHAGSGELLAGGEFRDGGEPPRSLPLSANSGWRRFSVPRARLSSPHHAASLHPVHPTLRCSQRPAPPL
ncbi:hypothetical protein GQ55_5G071700 [Panicum hallii var. hallii]|uniref:Uncharacterized protein n=1 Tax=Panicum hallii var. hallii TaxID=1504633 RepID=A0A2T7DDM3_9POAL|nr:hypothetical protein GQ55_5G071700 [Panicum hallii var. hallii]